MTSWIRFKSSGAIEFWILDGNIIMAHKGHMFDSPWKTDKTITVVE